MDWFLYDNGLRHERVIKSTLISFKVIFFITADPSYQSYV